jgi:hypothetical protein
VVHLSGSRSKPSVSTDRATNTWVGRAGRRCASDVPSELRLSESDVQWIIAQLSFLTQSFCQLDIVSIYCIDILYRYAGELSGSSGDETPDFIPAGVDCSVSTPTLVPALSLARSPVVAAAASAAAGASVAVAAVVVPVLAAPRVGICCVFVVSCVVC